MKRYLLGLLIYSLLLSGCGRVATRPTPPTAPRTTAETIEIWINQQDYEKAWLALSEIDSSHPDYDKIDELETRLDSEILAYERHVIDQAEKSVRSNHLSKALNEYESGLAKLPGSARLTIAFEKIQTQLHAQIIKIENKLLALKGEYLVKVLPEYEKISALDPRDETTKQRLDYAKKTADDLAVKISKLGSIKLAEGQQQDGAYLVKLASRLTSDPILRNRYSNFKSPQSAKPPEDKATDKKQVAKSNNTSLPEKQSIEKAIEKFDALLQQGKLYKAKILLDKLLKNPTHKNEISARRDQLKSAIKDKVSTLYQQGVDHYSKENYEIALNHWISVLQLQPDHEKAKEHNERTKRILERLEQLREKQHAAPKTSKTSASE